MIKLKYTLTILLLIALAVGVIFAPQLINKHRQEAKLNETVYRDYYAGNRPKLTGEQVARLYYNNEISLSYNSLATSIKSTNAIQNNIAEVTKQLFSGNEAIHKLIVDILSGNDITCARNNILIKVNDQPTALNFVNYAAYEEKGFFDILYEEKTKTVIRFSLELLGKRFSSIEEGEHFIKEITSMLYNYYTKQLNLSNDYFFVINYPSSIRHDGNLFSATLRISCELAKEQQDIHEGIFEIYN